MQNSKQFLFSLEKCSEVFCSIPAQFAFNVITTSFCYDFGVEGNTTSNLQKEVIFMGMGVSA